jgi:hypothetical protein
MEKKAIKFTEDLLDNIKQNENLSSEKRDEIINSLKQIKSDHKISDKQILNVIGIISLISSDNEFDDVKIFFGEISNIECLIEVIRRNNIALSEALPVIINLIYSKTQDLLKKECFDWRTMCACVRLITSSKLSEFIIQNILILINSLESNNDFDFVSNYLIYIASNKKIMKLITNNKTNIMNEVRKLHKKQFTFFSMRSYIFKIIDNTKFNMNTLIRIYVLLKTKNKSDRNTICSLTMQATNNLEFEYIEKFLLDTNDFSNATKSVNVFECAEKYYARLLNVYDDIDLFEIFKNHKINFNTIKDVLEFILPKEKNERHVILCIIKIINSTNEYNLIRHSLEEMIYIFKLSDHNNIEYKNLHDVLKHISNKYKIYILLTNKRLNLASKIDAIKILVDIEDVNKRITAANLMFYANSEQQYLDIKHYLYRLLDVDGINEIINNTYLSIDDLINLFKFHSETILTSQSISFDRIKILSAHLSCCNDEDRVRNIVALISLVENDNEFDIISSNIDDLLYKKDNEIIRMLAEKTLDIELVCRIYEHGGGDIFKNRRLSLNIKTVIGKIILSIDNASIIKKIIDIVLRINNTYELKVLEKFLADNVKNYKSDFHSKLSKVTSSDN